jgi:zinc transporter 2
MITRMTSPPFPTALTAHHMSRRTPTNTHNFGFHRAEILGALLSIMLIWAVTGVLVYEAVQRVIHPEDVDGRLMFIVACCGLALNLLLGLVLGHPGHSHSHGGAGGGHSHGGAAGAADSTALLGDAVELKVGGRFFLFFFSFLFFF